MKNLEFFPNTPDSNVQKYSIKTITNNNEMKFQFLLN